MEGTTGQSQSSPDVSVVPEVGPVSAQQLTPLQSGSGAVESANGAHGAPVTCTKDLYELLSHLSDIRSLAMMLSPLVLYSQGIEGETPLEGIMRETSADSGAPKQAGLQDEISLTN